MRKPILLLAASLGVAVLASVAHAQDMTATSATVGGTTIWVGGGVQFLSLPDIKFTGFGDPFNAGHRQTNSSSDWSDFGGSVGGGLETAIANWNGMRVTAGVKGFFSNFENSDNKRCTTTSSEVCFAWDPTGNVFFGLKEGDSWVPKTDRDVDYWGGQVEFKFGAAQPVHEKPNIYRNDYFIIGTDVRGIDQDNKIVTHSEPDWVYRETLDTTYVGGYIGLGGEYSFGFIPGLKNVGGLYDRLGIRTFVNLRAGFYDARTDYDGRFNTSDGFASKLSRSSDDFAFIGTVSLETRKQIGLRTSLSLWTDYEYISSVPKMRYFTALPNDNFRPTRIDDEGAFASRTMLRLNIGFGPAQLYEEPLK
jgi:hypothetical protein